MIRLLHEILAKYHGTAHKIEFIQRESTSHNTTFLQKRKMSTTVQPISCEPSTSFSIPTYSSVLSQPAPTPSQPKTPGKIPENYFKNYASEFPLVNPNGTFTLFNWKNTKSTLKHKPFVGRTPPDTNSPNTLFLDRKSNPRISDNDLLSFFRKDLLGIAFDSANFFLQLTFKDADTFNHYLSLPNIKINDKEIHLTPPKSFPKSSLVIHLHGMPIQQSEIISPAINQALSPYCDIKEIAPVLLKDTELLTPKWDAVVTPISGKQIPVHLQILNTSVALTWADSSPICLRCHNTNHKNQECPLRPAPHPRPSRTYAVQNISNTNANSHFHQNKSTMKINSSTNHSQSPDPLNSDIVMTDNSDDTTNNFNSTNTSLQNSMHAPPISMDTSESAADNNNSINTTNMSISSTASVNYAPLDSSSTTDTNDKRSFHTIFTRSQNKKSRQN
jgi:hypothetical protein